MRVVADRLFLESGEAVTKLEDALKTSGRVTGQVRVRRGLVLLPGHVKDRKIGMGTHPEEGGSETP